MDSSRRVLYVQNVYGGGEFAGFEGRIRPFVDDTLECVSEKTHLACAGGELNKGNFAAVTTRTSYAPVWLQAQKLQSLRWRYGIVMPIRV